MKFRSETEGFEVSCKNQKCVGGKIEVQIDSDSGYSNWTVMESGKISFKCHGCGKYGSTDGYDKPNELDNFEVLCLECSSYQRKDNNWEYNIQDVDGEDQMSFIECKTCGQRVYEYKLIIDN